METNTAPTSGVPAPAPVQPAPAPVAPAPAPEPVVPVAQPTGTGNTLPQGDASRTGEQFDKLTEHNRRLLEANRLLQEQLQRKQQLEQQFTPVQQAPVPQAPQIEQFIETDPTTGEQFVNQERLQKAIGEAQQRATRAETAVQAYIKDQQLREEQKQTEEAYKAHPELNPFDPKFDGDLTRRTRAFLVDSYYNPNDYSGRALTFREAADLAIASRQAAQPAPQAPVAPAPAPQSPQQNQTMNPMENKEQAALAAQGASSSAMRPTVTGSEDLQDLRVKTRKGDVWAVAQRLSKIPHTGTPRSSQETT